MSKPYSNFNATLAIAKASFRSILRSPSAVIFTLLFPLIFILVFGFIGGGGITVDVGVAKGSDVNNPIYKALQSSSVIHLVTDESADQMKKDLAKGHLDAVLDITKNTATWPVYAPVQGKQQQPPFTVNVQYTSASQEKGKILNSLISGMLFKMNSAMAGNTPPAMAELKETTVTVRAYKTIDFILPGQLGFSLLSTGVFGTAFVFLSLRQTLVIKRFFATPVKRYSIVVGEAIARITFALIGASFILLIGRFAFGFTLIHGVVTFINMLILSFIGVVVFMGFGFTVSGIAKNESTVPPIANLVTLPQFLLSGTFFSITVFPTWLQPICKILPLTFLNDAMRQVAFEGANLWDVSHQLFYLLLWGIGIYAVAVKAFKWE
ncbi:ABC transporter permease [Mucilaginibacter sp. E4BP6]|uniref:ABC transporter permease n=1 Tax=Mucilaginibacter sp. E4BP6 TaxID=2723089 RepID=UPI0015CE9CDB|nr:ABC transporter permease [Mucilaginibacter sp. E4BP6]NYE65413.1 ABC-2 type transport system permease protein [Mucilaginibacter sp. E4BP6]